MKLLTHLEEASPFRYQTKGGGHAQVGRPGVRIRRALGRPAHDHHKFETKKFRQWWSCTSNTGLPNPIAVFQRPTDDRTRDLDAQAGGFWLSRR